MMPDLWMLMPLPVTTWSLELSGSPAPPCLLHTTSGGGSPPTYTWGIYVMGFM